MRIDVDKKVETSVAENSLNDKSANDESRKGNTSNVGARKDTVETNVSEEKKTTKSLISLNNDKDSLNFPDVGSPDIIEDDETVGANVPKDKRTTKSLVSLENKNLFNSPDTSSPDIIENDEYLYSFEEQNSPKIDNGSKIGKRNNEEKNINTPNKKLKVTNSSEVKEIDKGKNTSILDTSVTSP